MKRLLPLLLLFLISNAQLEAASPVGGEVYYRHLKNMEYEVTIIAYRDCRATSMGMMDLYITNDSFSISTKTTRVKIEEVSNYCGTKACSPSNTTVGLAGTEAHYYMDTIDFNSGVFKKFISKKYCTVNFALSTCCRNGGISTVLQGNLYIDAMLNLCMAIQSPINSPQFINTPNSRIPCNQTYSVSYAANGYLAGDSVGYILANAQNDYKSFETYNGIYSANMPITPYCTPVGSYNCLPNISILPTRGTSFNNKNGNYIVTPSNCAEVPVIVAQVNLYRKDNGTYKLIGYIKRDFSHVIAISTINKPTLTTYKDYSVKARENTCIDIRIKDDTTNKNKDTVKVIVKNGPKYGKLSLLDSNAREKTLHYCWNVTDADYLNRLEDNVTIYAYDKACLSGQFMSTTINFKAAAPDSIFNLGIKTFYDINKNGKHEPTEPYRSAPILFNRNGNISLLNTDVNGSLSQKPLIGNFKIGLLNNQFTYTTTNDSFFIGKFDSTYSISIGFNYTQGIRGRVYDDVNNNCVYDPATDVLLNGVKVMASSNNAVAISDTKGEYLLNHASGTYTLTIDPSIAYQTSCINSYTVQLKSDSQLINYDFPLKKRNNFKDIKIKINPSNHVLNDASFTQQITVENLGFSTVSNFYISFLPSKKLQQFSSTSTNTIYNDTVFWLIDSIVKGGKKTIDILHTITKSDYYTGELIQYQVWANVQDSAMGNNYNSINETIQDSSCCVTTDKRTYAPNRYYPINKTITYRLNFIPVGLCKTALVTDTIDDSKFDLNTIQLIGSPTSNSTYLLKNILNINYISNNYITNTNFTYSIDLKQPIADSFIVRNTAYAKFDNGKIQKTNTVSNTIISPIEYDYTPIADVCSGKSFQLKFLANYSPQIGNRFKVYLSDSAGQFSQPSLLLDTACKSQSNVLTIQSPKVYLSHAYKIKIIGTNPATEAFSSITLPTVTIHPTPSIQYTTNIKKGAICYGDTLKIVASGAKEYWFFNYRKPGGTYTTKSTYSEKLFNSANYEISYKSDKGCTITSPVISTSINPLPVVKLSSPTPKVCEGDAIELQFQGALKYNIYLNSKTLVSKDLTTSPLTRVALPNKNYYTAYGTDVNGCKDSSNRIAITGLLLPSKPIITRVQRALKSNYSLGNQWLINGNKIDSAINQYFYPPFDATYSVRYTDTNTCQSTSIDYNVNYTSIDNLKAEQLFKVYPNPASEVLNLEPSNATAFTYQLFDSYGKLILENHANQKTSIDLAILSAGNYILNILQNNQNLHFKVSIVR